VLKSIKWISNYAGESEITLSSSFFLEADLLLELLPIDTYSLATGFFLER
jgi:hypothetical protein